IDSGLGYLSWNVTTITGDGLLTFRRVGGLGGSTIEPDLATSIPRATDAGRTYVFHVRPGIEYSTGQPVRASDFVRGIERSIRIDNPYIGYYFGGLLGGDKCTKTHCDLSRGIVADDRAGTVAFHLRAADSEFLDKLTLPGTYPVPPGTPMNKAEPLGVPGT